MCMNLGTSTLLRMKGRKKIENLNWLSHLRLLLTLYSGIFLFVLALPLGCCFLLELFNNFVD